MFFKNKDDRITDFFELSVENKMAISDDFGDWLKENGFFDAPASTKYHGNYSGGLYDHSRCVFDRLAKLTDDNNLKWMRPQSPFIVGMFHDLCKYDQYIPIMDNEYEHEKGKLTMTTRISGFDHNKNTLIKGHGTKSVMLLSQFITLTEEEMLCIRYHMGPYEKEEWTELDMAIRKYQNVYWTHAADMLASKVDGI